MGMDIKMSEERRCPVTGMTSMKKEKTVNKDWWPNQVHLNVLKQHSTKVDPMGKDFDYATEFNKIDYNALKQDLTFLMTDSQDWWPADYGHYGPFFIRMAWHSAGTYRTGDGRGGANSGTQRFAPLNSWPDNVNLDKARRLLWPIKQKYGKQISWADLMILAGNVALESMGFKTFGFAGGRVDVWESEEDVYWGAEKEWLANDRYSEEHTLENPLAAVQMGLIYVNPEGPNGVPDAVASGKDVRDTFARMAMNDEETVALVAGGHTFGKCHGAASPTHVGKEPEGAPLEAMGLGWISDYGSGHGDDTISSGIEGPWNATPTTWDNAYFDTLFGYDWNLVKSPAGAWQWVPSDPSAHTIPKAHDKTQKQPPIMTTADLSLRMDPTYNKIAKRYHEHPEEFADAFARAWFKLTHRDMGPKTRYLGPEVPKENLLWQDPIPTREALTTEQIIKVKQELEKTGLSISEMVRVAWASASTYRHSDFRGGANGARIALAPQKDWAVNQPQELEKTLAIYKTVQTTCPFVSLADLIVIAGSYGVEKAAANAGVTINVDICTGRGDATQEETDITSFAVLEPSVDGFRNYKKENLSMSACDLLIDKAQLLNLSAPEMTVLLGGLRVLNINYQHKPLGIFTQQKETLSTDFFVNVLDMSTKWMPVNEGKSMFAGVDAKTNQPKWMATDVDLLFGSHSELRAYAEVFASNDAKETFVHEFIRVWTKVMNADLF